MNGITPRISLIDVRALRPASFGAKTENGTTGGRLSPLEALLRPRSAAVERELPEEIPSGSFYGMVGRSPAMLSVFATLARMAAYPVTPLLLGEPGGGKSCAAKALHRASDRAAERMISFDCRQPQDLPIENILFGQVGGIAPAQNSPDRPGLLEMAHEGTLYLQEISELPIDVQVKLLRFLESREIRRVGSAQLRRLDVRIITSSERDLSLLCTQGKFRGDLLYRLNVGSIVLPPLREIPEDIPMLVSHLLERVAMVNGLPPQALSAQAHRELAAYGWPENVRQLFAVLLAGSRRACGREIQNTDLGLPAMDHPSMPGV